MLLRLVTGVGFGKEGEMGMVDSSELVISRVIKAPRAAVWRAWAEPLQFAK